MADLMAVSGVGKASGLMNDRWAMTMAVESKHCWAEDIDDDVEVGWDI